jgi:pyrimidine operon attenuation protein / uracil phosphoribosyltransferase
MTTISLSSTFLVLLCTPQYHILSIILHQQQLQLIISRLAHQITEHNTHIADMVIIGLQPRGVALSERIKSQVAALFPEQKLQHGVLDITFYRDDVRNELRTASKTDIPFSIENKRVILVDDVLYTGRTIRAALDALQDFGRPRKVELCVLVNRRFNRELPIQPDYCGKAIDTLTSQKVKVEWPLERVVVYT